MNAKKIVTAGLALVMVAGISMAGTLAYMTASSAKTNVFTVGNIGVTLTEPDWDAAENHKIYPGATLDKDPTVTVSEDSEDCYVYVGVKNNLPASIAGAMTIQGESSEWTKLEGVDGYIIYKYNDTVDGASGAVILPDVFTDLHFSEDLVQEDLGDLAVGTSDSIEVIAYAHQSTGIAAGDNVDEIAKDFFDAQFEITPAGE